MSNEIRNSQYLKGSFFQVLMFRFVPYWPLFLMLACLFLLGTWLYLKRTPPVYEAVATILIKDENKGVHTPGMELLDVFTSKKIVENEIEVIKSKSLMKRTVEKLRLYAPVMEEGQYFDRSAFTSSPVVVEIQNLRDIRVVEKVEFRFNENENTVTIEHEDYNLNEWINLPYGTLRFCMNENLRVQSGPRRNFYFSLHEPRDVVNELLRNVNVSATSKVSTVVNLSIKDEDSGRAEAILNELLNAYNEAAINDKNSLAANTLKFVEDRIHLVEKDLDSVENTIELYKATKGIVDLSEQGKLFLQNVKDNDQKLAEMNMKMAVLGEVEEYVIQNNERAGIVPSTLGIEDPSLSILIQKLYDSEIQYERLKKTTAENNPVLLSLRNEIENMRPGILENIRNQKLSLQASKVNLTSTNNQYSGILQSIPKRERELLEVNRQQAIKNGVYTFLLQKREETALSYSSTVGDSRVVDAAEASPMPVAPKRKLIYAVALILSCVAGMCFITFKEFFSSSVLFRSEIEYYTNVPIAGEISHFGAGDNFVIHNPKKPFIAEQFRQLRAAMGLYGKVNGKTLLVTSSISGEGKSFVSLNFAGSLASSGKKVVIVDLDFRNPRTTSYFQLGSLKGAAEYLKEEASLDEIVHSTNVSNLFVLSAGIGLQNATESFLNADLKKFFVELNQNFDFVIVDTAPVDPVTDAYLISPYCDATLFVVRHGKTPKTMMQMLDDNHKVKALNNIHIVFNGVKSRGMIKNAYGYGYGFGYQNVYSRKIKSTTKTIS